jgi:hypothetical protein
MSPFFPAPVRRIFPASTACRRALTLTVFRPSTAS